MHARPRAYGRSLPGAIGECTGGWHEDEGAGRGDEGGGAADRQRVG